MDLDVVLLPPKGLSRKLGNLVRTIHQRYPLEVAVDDRKLLPHISLLHLKVNAEKLPEIKSGLKLLADQHQAFGLKFSDCYFGSKFFCLKIGKAPRLQNLHQQIVMAISPLRSGITRLPALTKNQTQKTYFKQYGVANILKFFHPHITLGKLKKFNDGQKVLKFLAGQKLPNFSANRLALAQVDKYHQVRKIIKEFKLK